MPRHAIFPTATLCGSSTRAGRPWPGYRPGVIQLATGAWYDPAAPGTEKSLDKHGNPNVLTRDVGTSRLGQGPSAHSALVDIERFEGVLPPVTAHKPPSTVAR